MTHNGGVLIGAYDDRALVGIAFAFYAHREGRPILWSHMTGVLPGYQGQGVGEGLKRAQRDWALEHGIGEIRWTFDPLQRGNANFNLVRLGAVADAYHVNLYGTMNDAINAGLPSDRVEACWHLRNASQETDITALASAHVVLAHDTQSRPIVRALGDAKCILAEIPRNLPEMRIESPEFLLDWRLAVRKVLLDAFARGYVATSFVKVPDGDAEAYLLKRLRD
ncbi:MAG: GNAT family N-acetyltransferase [Chloroflexi bacterium]|nr:GNAT family N-acetyltransferase [Chloroflexota bacterium]